ncbi:hypothetical protein ADK75_35650 [Streptomyces virginiae]|uniref:Uncharacterized protein n=1 Tax=Streptomyces virginiae TaxID=1961 RepID=A0A0L8M232_STRVG|nr:MULTISPECIES: hypothetical protein [Streptomyces]KOG44446.1 hypothetical protein ADK75_35650 [Streptomyces virginiae]KOU27885.1 hypothetical protein ADK51_12390 [Streptomyces sp. WM6368]
MSWNQPDRGAARCLARAGVLAALTVALVSCSSGTPPEQTAEYRDGREYGVLLHEEGAWPNVGQARAEVLCEFAARTDYDEGPEKKAFIAGCVSGLRSP